ncbi:MAG: redox-regulated ATPase YchF [Bacteroidales bacterium]|nr:redox-regulated ATPase YchF [Bacteroidales bacterium]HOL97056.1 redox-regulated ATPase YchF [Bacteroidales bacterium]HOM35965.1 redox-regulated ATPase YchF [Bacteroidales bacterium]HPD23421.1 redox-regulated ATPase YchF [Bacteroidales bacterium]HRS99411.1 redox-regulated ATPase YchF [Bacteroidales bacterium]
MGLNCGIIGIANCGKTTLFNCMSNTKAETSNYAFSSNKSNIAVINVPDPRLKELEKYQKTEKLVPATVEIIDIPGLTKGSSSGEGVGNQFLADIRNTDALIHVLRCFDDDNLPHVEGSVNPVRDMETIDLELQIKDLESINKKILRMEKLLKGGDKEAKAALEVLHIYKEHLENMQNARTAPVSDEDKKYIADLFLLTAKPVMFVCNIDEASINNLNHHVKSVKEALAGQDVKILTVAAALEAEIAELETEEEKLEFLADYGLKEPSVNLIIREAYDLLNLQSFFTVGPKEIRAWTIKKGMTAPEAAGVIHSDLQRGFIRAEVMKYNDFIELGSEQAVKNAGKFHVEGKTYIVEDGDILHIRFNV